MITTTFIGGESILKCQSLINNTICFFSKERFYVGASLLRIAFGCMILYFYVMHFSQRHFLFSDYGVTQYSTFFYENTLSLYNFSSSLIYFDVVYILGIIVALGFTLGYKGRLVSILNFIFFSSLYIRFFYIGDGGDNLMYLALFFLMFANTSRYFSIDNYLKDATNPFYKNEFQKKLSNILQNFVIIFCTAQICVIYLTSGFYQVMGDSWNNGTAIYYISQVKSISMPFLEEMARKYIYLSVIISYASVLVKLAFPLLILNRRTKLFAVISVCLFHVGIAVGMGLYSFSIAMIAMELLIFTDQEYKLFWNKISNVFKKILLTFKTKSNNFGEAHLKKYRMIVFYDSWCPFCQNTKEQIKKLDFFDLIMFKSFREVQIQEEYNLEIEEVSKRMHSVSNNKELVSGISSFIDINKRIIIMWPFLPLLILSKYIGIGSFIYDLVASNRNIIPVNQCENLSCELPKKGE